MTARLFKVRTPPPIDPHRDHEGTAVNTQPPYPHTSVLGVSLCSLLMKPEASMQRYKMFPKLSLSYYLHFIICSVRPMLKSPSYLQSILYYSILLQISREKFEPGLESRSSRSLAWPFTTSYLGSIDGTGLNLCWKEILCKVPIHSS